MGTAQPTPAGLRAAQEVLDRAPNYCEGRPRDQVLEALTSFHAEVGDSRFRLLFGLREPIGYIESIIVQHHTGRITWDQFKKLGHDYVHRSVDETMLRAFYGDLETRVVAYGMAHSHAVYECRDLDAGVIDWWDEPQMERLLKPVRAKLRLFKQELITAWEFSTEVRVERELGLVKFGDTLQPSAAIAALRLRSHFDRFWAMALGRDDFRRSPLTPNTAFHLLTTTFPSAASLQSLLHAEYAAARLVLKDRLKSQMPPAPVTIHATTCEVVARNVNITSPTGASASQPTAEPQAAVARVRIARWSDLAIAVTASQRIAFTPPPMLGSRVRPSDGVQVRLSGDRWAGLFEVATLASNGRTISEKELRERLVRPPRKKAARTSVSREHAMADGLHPQPKPRDRLRTVFSELRGMLRQEVECAEPAEIALFRTSGDELDLGFTIQALLEDDGGKVTFGTPR